MKVKKQNRLHYFYLFIKALKNKRQEMPEPMQQSHIVDNLKEKRDLFLERKGPKEGGGLVHHYPLYESWNKMIDITS